MSKLHETRESRLPEGTNSSFSTISQYQQEYKGIVEYYRLTYNLHRLKWIMEQSLTKTLAHKFRITVSKVYDRFGVTVKTLDGPRKILKVEVHREKGRHPLVSSKVGWYLT